MERNRYVSEWKHSLPLQLRLRWKKAVEHAIAQAQAALYLLVGAGMHWVYHYIRRQCITDCLSDVISVELLFVFYYLCLIFVGGVGMPNFLFVKENLL